jgi:hypothetical protein
MTSKQLIAYPRSVGSVALEPPVWIKLAIDDPSDPSRDNVLSGAMGILMGIGLSAFLWGLMTLLLYGAR